MRYAGILKIIAVTTSLSTLLGCNPTTDIDPDNPGFNDKINQKPIAVISPITEQSIFIGDTINFLGDSSFDPDSDMPLNYIWTFSGATSSIQHSSAENPGQVSFSEVGVAIAHLMVTDNRGLTSDATSVIVNVYPEQANRAPNGAISYKISNGAKSTGNFSVSVGTSVEFFAEARDEDDDPVTDFDWTFPSGITAPVTAGKAPFSINFTTAGTYLIALTVTDNTGNTDLTPAQVTVTVMNNATVNFPPNGSISHDSGNGSTGSTDNLRITTGTSVVFSGNADDPENDPVTYAWNFPANVSVPANPGRAPVTASFPTAGVYVISLSVTDDNNNTDPTPARVTVTVTDTPVNLPPNGSISHDGGNGSTGSTGNLRIITGTSVIFDGNAVDPENDPVSYAWEFPPNVNVVGNPGSTPFSASFPTAGSYNISLSVTDNNGNQDPTPARITVTVTDISVNLPPNGSISHDKGDGSTGSTGNLSIAVGASVVFSGSAVDPENDPVTYTWNFPANISVPNNPGGTPFTADFPSTGVYVISLSVSDNNGNVDPTPARVTVIVADEPVNLSPNGSISHDNGNGSAGSTGNLSIAVGASVVFSGSAVDPENDPVTYTWRFPANVIVPANPGGTPFTASFPTAGTYPVSLSVADNNGNVDPTPAQITVTVSNSPVNLPPNGSISHDNGDGSTGSTGNLNIAIGTSVVFSGSAIDLENDPVTYTWTFPPNVTVPANPGSTPFTVSFPTAGTYLVSLGVTDNNGNADPTPAQVTVTVTNAQGNLAPNGAISHDNGNGASGTTGNVSVATGATILFSGSAADPENDTVAYFWSFEGATPASATGSGPINVSYNSPGTFNVKLTVSDSNGNSDLTPAELTVTVNANMPAFKRLTVIEDEDGNPNDSTATYSLNANDNVSVNVETPTGSWTTPMMRYNDMQRPPVVVAKRGTKMTFNVQNNLTEETTVHWHGFKIPGFQDGGPDFPIEAGSSRVYEFTLEQPAGALWFHPHAHGTTATQVYNGLAGALILTDDITDNLESNKQIPTGDHDVALLIQDRQFTADNGSGQRALTYSATGIAGILGMLGDHILVNGVELPSLKVDTRQYRLRLFNGSNARTYDFALADGANFSVVGTDGGLLNAPVQTDHIMLGAGERAEIVVDFGNHAIGDSAMLVSRAFTGGGMMGGGSLPNGAVIDIMHFDVTTQATDDVTLYTSLPANADINTRLIEADATATRSFIMSMGGMGGMGMQFQINGKLFDINRVDEVVTAGATEIWDISNISVMAHPFHAHAIQWQVLDRNNTPASGVDLGWKDTVLVQPGESVRIIGRFDPVVNIGKYMYHCHILEHEDAGMMGIFEIQ